MSEIVYSINNLPESFNIQIECAHGGDPVALECLEDIRSIIYRLDMLIKLDNFDITQTVVEEATT